MKKAHTKRRRNGTPAVHAQSGNGTPEAGRSWLQRFLVFIVGTIILLLPPWLIHKTLSESADLEQHRQRQAASELLDTSINLARHQDLGRLLLVEQLEEEAQRLAARVSKQGESSFASETLRLAARLKKAGLAPTLILTLPKSPENERPSVLAGGVYGRHSPAELEFLRHFLTLTTQTLTGPVSATESREISESVPNFLGSIQTISYYSHEMRGAAAQILFRNENAILFWMPLLDPLKTTATLCTPVSPDLFNPCLSTLRRETWKQLVSGGILFIMPPPAAGKSGIRSTIRRYAAQGIRLAFIPEDGSGMTAQKDWYETPLQSCLQGSPQPPDWVIGQGTAFVGKRYKVVGAVKLPTKTSGEGTRAVLILVCCWAVAGAGLIAWFLAVFHGRGLAASLGKQLSAGFLLAALFPLTTTFLIIEPYAAERYEVRTQEIRADLRSTIRLLELQSLSHRPRLWHLMSRLFTDPAFLGAARRDASGSVPGADADLGKRLHDKFRYLHQKPLDISMRKVIIAGLGSYVRDQARPGDPGGNSSMLAQLMNKAANEAISSRGGVEASSGRNSSIPDPERGSAAETRREMLSDVGRDIFLAVLGPESFFDWLNGKNEPLLIEVGLGMAMIYEILMPDGPHPEFLLTILLKAEDHERIAMARTLSGTWRDGPVFAFQRDLLGEPSYPESGERYPFLRRIARQIDAAAKPLSLRLSDGTTSWLLEGTPSELSRQFIFTAIADEAPLRAEAESIKRRLTAMLLLAALVTLLLAASATRDVVSPIKQLIEGIRAISVERYSYRVDTNRSDELGELAGAFNAMARGLEERKILSHMVSSSALDATASRDYEAKAREGQRHEAIVCFVSFVGAEATMATLTPEEALTFLNRQVVAACRILHAAGADIDKLLGPKILAIFSPELGAAAVEAARKLQSAHQDGQLDLRPAIGLTRGSVISGILGSGDRRDHTVIGDTVNLAARAASIAEKLDPVAVVLDDLLRSSIGDVGEFESLGETHVKGKTKPVRLVRLLDRQGKPDPGGSL